jgi:AcrR family transcriptional regulator
LTIAVEQFATTGLGSTTSIQLAKAAGVSEAVLYIHFGTKRQLFEAAVQRNVDRRLSALQERFGSIPNVTPVECVERMAEATILACAEGESKAALMAWALMELPEYAADVYRSEMGSTAAMWDAEIARRFGGSLAGTRLMVHLAPYAVHACMAFGFWLSALRHNPATAAAHARQYAGGLADAARTVIGLEEDSPACDGYGAQPEPTPVG